MSDHHFTPQMVDQDMEPADFCCAGMGGGELCGKTEAEHHPTKRGMKPMKGNPWMFVLDREEDVSGVSGTGVVAEGIEFSDGTVALRWMVGEYRSTVIWPNITAVRAVHGHDGKTKVRFL